MAKAAILRIDVNLLNEIAVRAKYDGSFTQDWVIIRNRISSERCLEEAAGGNEIQKLKAWAESQGLLMEFEMEFGGFCSAIRSLTFWNARDAVQEAHNGPSLSTEEPLSSGSDEVVAATDVAQARGDLECIHNDFDWDSVRCAGEGDDDSWAPLSHDVDYAFIGSQGESSSPPEASIPNTPTRKQRRGAKARTGRKARKNLPATTADSEQAFASVSTEEAAKIEDAELVEA